MSQVRVLPGVLGFWVDSRPDFGAVRSGVGVAHLDLDVGVAHQVVDPLQMCTLLLQHRGEDVPQRLPADGRDAVPSEVGLEVARERVPLRIPPLARMMWFSQCCP